MGKHDIKLKSMLTATNVIHTIYNDSINNQMNGENRPLHLFCLISVDHTNSQLPTLIYILKWSNVIFNVENQCGISRLHVWMRIYIFVQLYFATNILNRTCTLVRNATNSKMDNIDNQNLVTHNISVHNPITNLLTYQRLKLQVQLNNKDELQDQKYNTKDKYLLIYVGVKRLLLSPLPLSLATRKDGQYIVYSNHAQT
jgi:hypothetical protein